MLDAFRPGKIRDMYQAVNAFFNPDKYTKIRNIFDLALNNRTGWIVLGHEVPRIRLQLFHAERYTLGIHIDIQNNHLNLITYRDNLGRVFCLFGPGHLRDMNKPLHSFLKFSKHAIIGYADHFPGHLLANRISLLNRCPRVLFELFYAKGNLVGILVVFQNLYFNLFTDLKKLGRMRDPAPGKISYMTESVKTSQINENTIIGYICNGSGDNGIFLERGPHLLTEFVPFFLEDCTAGNNNIIPLTIIFQNLKVIGLSEKIV